MNQDTETFSSALWLRSYDDVTLTLRVVLFCSASSVSPVSVGSSVAPEVEVTWLGSLWFLRLQGFVLLKYGHLGLVVP